MYPKTHVSEMGYFTEQYLQILSDLNVFVGIFVFSSNMTADHNFYLIDITITPNTRESSVFFFQRIRNREIA